MMINALPGIDDDNNDALPGIDDDNDVSMHCPE